MGFVELLTVVFEDATQRQQLFCNDRKACMGKSEQRVLYCIQF